MIFWAHKIENKARLTHFWPKTMPFFGKYLYVDKVDEIFIRIRAYAHNPHEPHIPHTHGQP